MFFVWGSLVTSRRDSVPGKVGRLGARRGSSFRGEVSEVQVANWLCLTVLRKEVLN
jgi:hypothetical protein